MTVVAAELRAEAGLRRWTAEAYVSAALGDLAAIRNSGDWGWLEVHRPGRTAAFSRRDTLAVGYPQAAAAARRHGFEPVIRPAGGRMAAYHQGALIVDVIARHPSPAADIERRFATFGEAIASALRTLGVDARLGPVPGEYCPGRFSVNGGGRTKLAGTAQRLTRGSFLLTAVILVSDPEPIRSVLAETYSHLGLEYDPATVGCVSDHLHAVTSDEVQAVLLPELANVLPLRVPAPGPGGSHLRLPLLDCWSAE
jgi:octanoyl-[GcvH]:protein N-octanoyltransferase